MGLDENNQVYLGGWYVKICNLHDHSHITILDIVFFFIIIFFLISTAKIRNTPYLLCAAL